MRLKFMLISSLIVGNNGSTDAWTDSGVIEVGEPIGAVGHVTTWTQGLVDLVAPRSSGKLQHGPER
jgi:hypothetical protein